MKIAIGCVLSLLLPILGCSNSSSRDATPTESHETVTPSRSIAEAPEFPIRLREADGQQSILVEGSNDAYQCPILLLVHIGEQDKAVPSLVVHGATCSASLRLEQRVANLLPDWYFDGKFTQLAVEHLDLVYVLINDIESLRRTEHVLYPRSLPGKKGTFFVVAIDDEEIAVGKLMPNQACELFRELSEFPESAELQGLVRTYQKMVYCKQQAP
jgi:hypothetical protein